MSSDEFWKDKCLSRNSFVTGIGIWIFLIMTMLLVETITNYAAVKKDMVAAQAEQIGGYDFLTLKEQELINCPLCE